jgi:subtilisin family serine protease
VPREQILESTDAPTRAIQNLRATLGVSAAQTGAGVGIAIIDSGVAPTSDLGTSIKAFYDFTGGRQLLALRNEGYGHGTHVAGPIAGSGARVWGDNAVRGDNIVWGDNVVRGDNIARGDTAVRGDVITTVARGVPR